jgi:alpha-tubulin suppressor-like RCC1 family protein
MKTPQTLKLACLLCIIALQAVTSEGQTVTKVAAGGYHSLFLKSDGSLWTMGDNDDGELGDGTYNQANLPEQIVASNITAIAAGVFHSLFLKSDGSLWTMGDNSYGELGDGTTDNDNYNTNLPEQIVASNVTAIAAGVFHSLFLKSDGSLWVMGNNGYGQLGDGTYNTTNLPEQIVASNVTAIAAGRYHSLFLKSDGSLWAMGYNASGQLGDGTYNQTNRPEQIVATNVTAIAAGWTHSLFLKSDGSLWAMGYNGYGQLGDGTYNQTNRPEQIVATNVTAIAAGYFHSLFLQSDGSLWAMGNNYDGQLGDGTTDNDNYNTNWPEQIVASNVTAIAGGGDHSLFLQSDGSLWAMGDNASGQLGDGTYNQINLPEQIVAGSSVPPGYNQISGQLLGTGDMQLSFVGIAGANYALDHSFSLAPPNWAPQLTNPTDAGGVLVFTNTPDPTTNNFWRIRSVP